MATTTMVTPTITVMAVITTSIMTTGTLMTSTRKKTTMPMVTSLMVMSPKRPRRGTLDTVTPLATRRTTVMLTAFMCRASHSKAPSLTSLPGR